MFECARPTTRQAQMAANAWYTGCLELAGSSSAAGAAASEPTRQPLAQHLVRLPRRGPLQVPVATPPGSAHAPAGHCQTRWRSTSARTAALAIRRHLDTTSPSVLAEMHLQSYVGWLKQDTLYINTEHSVAFAVPHQGSRRRPPKASLETASSSSSACALTLPTCWDLFDDSSDLIAQPYRSTLSAFLLHPRYEAGTLAEGGRSARHCGPPSGKR